MKDSKFKSGNMHDPKALFFCMLRDFAILCTQGLQLPREDDDGVKMSNISQLEFTMHFWEAIKCRDFIKIKQKRVFYGPLSIWNTKVT